MADHLINLNDKQESAAASIVANIIVLTGNVNYTVDKWIKDVVVAPIKIQIAAQDAARLAPIEQALPDATNNQINQIKAILGIP